MSDRTQPSSTRRYDSSGRRARAERTRRDIISAAHDLFVADGYAATTMAAIATSAQVSQPTIYSAFGSKAALLKQCIDVALAGDDDAIAVADRPLAKWVYDTDDPRELLGRYATMMGTLAKQAAPIFDVLVRAADSEPGLGELLDDLERQRHRAAGMVAEAIVARRALPPGRTLQQARDTIWILNAPELYTTLTKKRGWTQRAYVAWARDSLIKLVVEPAIPGTASRP